MDEYFCVSEMFWKQNTKKTSPERTEAVSVNTENGKCISVFGNEFPTQKNQIPCKIQTEDGKLKFIFQIQIKF